jgi:hypothetical protein
VSTTACGARLRLRRPGRIADPDHVAADVARQKIVEERRHQERAQQRSAPDRDLLRVKQQMPAPGTDQQVDRVDAERDDQPEHGRAAHRLPQPRDIDLPEQHHQEDDADRELEDEEEMASSGCWLAFVRRHSGQDRVTVLRFHGKITHPCAF